MRALSFSKALFRSTVPLCDSQCKRSSLYSTFWLWWVFFHSLAILISLSSLSTVYVITAVSSGSGEMVSKCMTLRKGKIQRSYQRRMSCLSSKHTTPCPSSLEGCWEEAEPSSDSSGTDKTGRLHSCPSLFQSWFPGCGLTWKWRAEDVGQDSELGSVYKSMTQVVPAAGVLMVAPGVKA